MVGIALTAGSGGALRHWGAAAFCVASVSFGDIDVPFVWQAWHLVTQLCHTHTHTYNSVTHTHTHLSHTTLSRTTRSHT